MFFDPAAFRPTAYLANWGARRMLNGDASAMTLAEFLESSAIDDDALWFVRPDDDLKSFTGVVTTRAALPARLAEEPGGAPPPSTPIVVAPPKTFGHEWRLFIVDRGLVGCFCYSNGSRDLAVPPEVETFAIRAARSWSPAHAFTLDVTIDGVGSPRIIEANCINGGFNFADMSSIVRAVSRFQELTWSG